ncbi:MAG: GlsB/YeaQ/YmgE family stress response membrane protein [Acidobacteriota bacterium]
MLLLGLISWLTIGLLAGLLAAWLLPGEPPLGWWQVAGVGVGGALVGGLLATALGFGGLASYDVRSLATATSSAVLGLLWLRDARLSG